MKVSSRFVVVVVGVLFALLTSACQAAALSPSTSSAAQIPQITLKAKDFSFEGPKQVEAGLVSITLENDGQEEHHAQLLRLNDGVTMDQVMEAMKKGPEAALAMVTTAGGPSVVMPGKSQQVTLDGTGSTDPDGDALSYTATGLPTGLAIDPAEGAVEADLLALHDDLAQAAEAVQVGPGPDLRRYLAGFLAGLARQTRDDELAAASLALVDPEAGLAGLSHILGDRLARTEAFRSGAA